MRATIRCSSAAALGSRCANTYPSRRTCPPIPSAASSSYASMTPLASPASAREPRAYASGLAAAVNRARNEAILGA